MEMKEFLPQGGACPWRPFGSPMVIIFAKIDHITKIGNSQSKRAEKQKRNDRNTAKRINDEWEGQVCTKM